VISFRYHVVSTVAVFLGIVLGVVVGATALNGAVVGDLRRQVSDLKADSTRDADTNKRLTVQANNANVLAQVFGGNLVPGRLAGVPVVIVRTPGATDVVVNSVASEIAAAGGTLAGVVGITKDLVDPRRANDVRTLVTSGVHPIGLTLPTTDDAGRLAGALLGYVLLGKGQGTDLTQTVTGLTTLNMLKAYGNPAAGKLVVVVSPGAVPGDGSSLQTLASLVGQMGSTGPVVVAGDAASASANGLIGALRGADVRKAVSTVDDIDTPLGLLTLVFAGNEALQGKHGQYGTSGNVDGLIPGAAQ
jgi:hypothetical protein